METAWHSSDEVDPAIKSWLGIFSDSSIVFQATNLKTAGGRGAFNLTGRVYAAKEDALTDKWNPPAVIKVEDRPESLPQSLRENGYKRTSSMCRSCNHGSTRASEYAPSKQKPDLS